MERMGRRSAPARWRGADPNSRHHSGRTTSCTETTRAPVREIVAWAWKIATLEVGDVFACGTNHQGLAPMQDGETGTTFVPRPFQRRRTDRFSRLAATQHPEMPFFQSIRPTLLPPVLFTKRFMFAKALPGEGGRPESTVQNKTKLVLPPQPASVRRGVPSGRTWRQTRKQRVQLVDCRFYPLRNS